MAIEITALSPYPAEQTVSMLKDKLDMIEKDTEFSSITVLWKNKYVWLYFCKNDEAGTPVAVDDNCSDIMVIVEFSHAFVADEDSKRELQAFAGCLTHLGFMIA